MLPVTAVLSVVVPVGVSSLVSVPMISVVVAVYKGDDATSVELSVVFGVVVRVVVGA